MLPKRLGPTFGLNNSHFWLPQETLGTDDGYLVVPEMIHHLHCIVSVSFFALLLELDSLLSEFASNEPLL